MTDFPKDTPVSVAPKDTEEIVLEVVDFPYCGIGHRFCVALDRADRSGEREHYPVQPLIITALSNYRNYDRFAKGRRWRLVPEDTP